MTPPRLPISLIASLVLIYSPTGSSASDLRNRFDLVSIGTSYEAVLAAMPPPASSTETSWLGIPYAQLRWEGEWRGPVFVISLIGGRVYAKTSCVRTADC